MRILKERESVTCTIWFTYVTGYDFDEHGEPRPLKEVLRARAGVAAAQNYLRHARNDTRLVVTDVQTERTVWTCDIDTFLSVANNTDQKET